MRDRIAALPARLDGLRLRPRMAVAAGCGVALTLAQPPLHLWPLILIAYPVLLRLTDGVAGRGAFLVGWAAGAGFFFSGLYWIGEAFLVDIARDGWMAPIAIAAMGGGLALFWGAAFYLARCFAWPGGWRSALSLALGLSLLEFARSMVLTGFPWALPAYVWVGSPPAQAASVIGPHGLSFLTILAAALIGARAPVRYAPTLAGVALLALCWGHGAWRLAAPESPRAEPVTIRIVQPNAAQRDKWRPELMRMFFDRHMAYTADDRLPRPDIVVWPETAVPVLLEQEPDIVRAIAANAGGAHVILGGRRLEDPAGDRRWYNALFVLSPDGRIAAHYDKHHLVPFGEYLPLKGVFSRLGFRSLVAQRGGFSAGDSTTLIDVPGVPPLLPQICYETIFPHETRSPDARADWIVQITNDAWFGESAGPRQHLAQARMRAIEQGLPVVRAANTGISAVIDAKGRIVDHLPLLQEGLVQAELPQSMRATIYAKTTDWYFVAPMALFWLVIFAQSRRIRLNF